MFKKLISSIAKPLLGQLILKQADQFIFHNIYYANEGCGV
jgi:hypothetical protein